MNASFLSRRSSFAYETLADARLADEQDRSPAAGERVVQARSRAVQLLLASDEALGGKARCRVALAPGRSAADGAASEARSNP